MPRRTRRCFAERLRRATIGAGLEPKAAVLERGFNQNFTASDDDAGVARAG